MLPSSRQNRLQFQRKLGDFTFVSVTHWPKIYLTVTLQESLWHRISPGQEEQEEAGGVAMGRVGPAGSGVPTPPQNAQEATVPFPVAGGRLGPGPKRPFFTRRCQSFSLAQWPQTSPELCCSQHGPWHPCGDPAGQPAHLCRQLLGQAQRTRDLARGEEERGPVSRALC